MFQQPHYSEAFVTSILLSIPEGVKGGCAAGSLRWDGDGEPVANHHPKARFSSSVAMAGTGIPRSSS